MPFEYAVRPFESRDSQGRVIIPSTPSGHDRATLTWGAKTSVNQVKFDKTGGDVECCKDNRTQETGTAGAFTSSRGKLIQQVWGPGTGGPPEPHGQWGAEIFVDQSVSVLYRKEQEDSCAAEWNQMSGVASAVNGAFASLEADIEAGGAGKTVDHCKARVNTFYSGGSQFLGNPSGTFPQTVPAYPPPDLKVPADELLSKPPTAPA
jgi:hypothetical protein